MATILVTGGCGYIGSHTVLELLNKNYDVVVVDNFSNSSFESLRRVQKITGKEVTFYEADIRDVEMMEKIFSTHTFDAVIHFAAFKAVGESCKLPLKYYETTSVVRFRCCRLWKSTTLRRLFSPPPLPCTAIPNVCLWTKLAVFRRRILTAAPSS